MKLSYRFVQWLWGDPLMRVVRVKSWWPSLDQYGIAWPVTNAYHGTSYGTSTPIWNWAWFRNRVGCPPRTHFDARPM